MSVSIEQCQNQGKSRLTACRQRWIFLDFDRAKAREREEVKLLRACTAEEEKGNRAKAREREEVEPLRARTAEEGKEESGKRKEKSHASRNGI